MVAGGRIARGELNGRDHALTAWTADGEKRESAYPQVDGQELVETLRAHDVAFTVEGTKRSALSSALTYLLRFLISLGFWIFLLRQTQGGGAKLRRFGNSPARRIAPDSAKITFRDVAGVDEAVEELHEIKEFLENRRLAARVHLDDLRVALAVHAVDDDLAVEVPHPRAELTDNMAMTLGGRAAEEIVFGEITTGAQASRTWSDGGIPPQPGATLWSAA